jgi:hypothetical protein
MKFIQTTVVIALLPVIVIGGAVIGCAIGMGRLIDYLMGERGKPTNRPFSVASTAR